MLHSLEHARPAKYPADIKDILQLGGNEPAMPPCMRRRADALNDGAAGSGANAGYCVVFQGL